MTPNHHPSETLIASCASGALRPGAALIVRAHMEVCPDCRREFEFFERLGGALLEAEPEAEMGPHALQRTLAMLDAPEPAAAPALPRGKVSPHAEALPPALQGLSFGKRRWMAPGVSMTPVKTDQSSRELVYLLRIGPGMLLPRHTHTGSEFTCVLTGSFSDQSGRYAPGDFVEADNSVEHSPVVGGDEACICLISTDAPLVMRDLMGRLFQPFAGI